MEPERKIEPTKLQTAAIAVAVIFELPLMVYILLQILPAPCPAYGETMLNAAFDFMVMCVTGAFFLSFICAFLFIIASLIFCP